MKNIFRKKITLQFLFCYLCFVSSNSFAQWVQQVSPVSWNMNDVQFVDNNVGYIAGDNGTILKTTDGGSNWLLFDAGTIQPITDLFFLDENIGWTAGILANALDEPIVLKTTDGGFTWNEQKITDPPLIGFQNLFFVDSDFGWVIDEEGRIYETTDGGSNWFSGRRILLNTMIEFPIDIFYLDANNWFATVLSGGLLKTTNAGFSWERLSVPLGRLNSVFFIDINTGWTAGDNGSLYRTTDGGLTWDAYSAGISGTYFSIHFADRNFGWALGDFGFIFMSTNGGASWFDEPSPTILSLKAVHFPSPGNGWAVGEEGAIIKRQVYFSEQTDISIIDVSESAVDWGDYDNDGDLDLFVAGSNEVNIAEIYESVDGVFYADTLNIFPGVRSGSVEWGDYDNDGDLDILLTGIDNDFITLTKVYRNNGDKTFSEPVFINLPGIWQGSATWGDYDNDGDLDIFLSGVEVESYVTDIYRNNNNVTFTAIQSGIEPGSYASAWGDYDNDGDLDLLIAGNSNSGVISRIYRNDGAGVFTPVVDLNNPCNGSCSWGDFDSDGDLDILLTGYNINFLPNAVVYQNNGADIFQIYEGFSSLSVGLSTGAWGDYDNDGDLDIIITGEIGDFIPYTGVFRNDDSLFIEQTVFQIEDVYNGAVKWADYDNDNDLDFILTGQSIQGTISKIYQNESLTPNSVPSAPSNLQSQVLGSTINLSWDKSTDGETAQDGLGYNLVIGTMPGGINELSPMADRLTGLRKVVKLGNTTSANNWHIDNLADGDYYWSLQTIDNNFAGSQFAPEESFYIGLLFPIPIITSINPTNIIEGSPGLTITIDGSDFIQISVVRFEGNDRLTTFVNANQLTAQLLAGDLLTPGNYSITVFNPEPGGGISNSVTFTVNSIITPQILSISPNSAYAGGPEFNLTVTGSNFIANSNVRFDGGSRMTIFNSGTQLTAVIPAGDISGIGNFEITVFNPAPHNSVSNSVIFTVDSVAVPLISSISPVFVQVTPAGRNLTVRGQNFIDVSVVQFNNQDRTTTFVSAAELMAVLLPGDLALADTNEVAVFNPPTTLSNVLELITFEYQDSVVIQTNFTFNDFENTESYRMIGLPGDNDLPLGDIVPGEHGSFGDWLAFWDSGSGSYVAYDGSSVFNLTPGRAFWVLSKNTVTLNDSAESVSIDQSNNYLLPLHDEWNLISNPFNKNILWTDVQTANPGITEPIYFFQAGNYIEPNPTIFEPYLGYYFFNNPSFGMSSLAIPFISTNSGAQILQKQSRSKKEIKIILYNEDAKRYSLLIGFDESAKQGLDKLEQFSPPANFNSIDLSIFNDNLETNYKYLRAEYRPSIAEGQEYTIVLKNDKKESLHLEFERMESFADEEIYLVEERLKKSFNLKEQNRIDISNLHSSNIYKMLIGSSEFINSKLSELMPSEYLLYQNYPNPFNPVTVIRFSLPKSARVNLSIFNSLGEKVEELIADKLYEAGFHEIEFNSSSADRLLASGVYIYRLSAGTFASTKKMVLLK